MKKIISMIICVCMLASMCTFVVSAAGVSVGVVRITMTEPKAGGEKPMDAKVPETASSVVQNITWAGNFDANGRFVSGETYTVFVEVGLKDSRSEFKDTLSTLSMNEKPATLYSRTADKKTIVASYSYKISGPAVTASAPTSAPAEPVTPAEPGVSGFVDVKAGDWYASAVQWAVEKGITAGTSATTFSPDTTCTKAQVLTFLWRAMGSPKHEGVSKFLNMSEDDYYYHAVHWAQSKNMISGPKFDEKEYCSRSTTVFFLWKLAGSPRDMYSHSSQFTDLPFGGYTAYYVGWAVSKGITSGTSETTFSPDATCTRGQIVTFLQRAFN